MNSNSGTREATHLLTPTEAAQRLLEEATRTAVRTGGEAGLMPIQIDGRAMFRSCEVECFAMAAIAVRHPKPSINFAI